jgi:gliding motility-associated-like protein
MLRITCYPQVVYFEYPQTPFMKKVYSVSKILSLFVCMVLAVPHTFAQCVNQGSIANPACGGSTTQNNVGGGQEWDLDGTIGGDYSVSISTGTSGCGAYSLATTSFAATSNSYAEDVYAGTSCCWAAGGTSAVLTYTRISYTNTTSNVDMCNGSQRTLMLNAVPLDNSGVWNVTNGTGTASVSGATLTATGAGTVSVSFTKGGCTTNSVTITIDPDVSITTAPAGGALCETSTFSYGGTPAGGTWSVTGNGGINSVSGLFTPATIASPIASQPSVITYSKGTCSATSNLTVDATPTAATATATQNICGSTTSGSLGGNTPVVGTGLWSISSGPGSTSFSPSASTPGATATAGGYGTYIYDWTITNGVCAASTAGETVNYYATPTTASVGPTQNLCGTLVATLSGDNATTGTGTWTQTGAPAGGTTVFTNPNSGTTSATASIPGTYTYTWTIANGTCPSTSASLIVNYYATPTTATGGPTQNICGSLTSTALAGDSALVGTGTWTQTSGPAGGTSTFSNANSDSSTATASIVGTYVYTWTIANGTCTPTSATTTVNYYVAPTTAVSSPAQSICGSLSAVVTGNNPTVGTGAWSADPSNPGVSSITAPNANSTGVNVSVPGTYIFTWTITNGTCTSSANDTVSFYGTPTTASVGPTQNLCGTLVSNPLGGNNPTTGTGAWTQASGPAGGTTIFSYADSGDATATVSIPGSYTYTWTISNGTCAPSSASVVVNFVASPSGGAIANTSYCSSAGTGTVSVTGVSNATVYVWSLPAGISGSSTTSTITVGGSAPGIYTVTATPEDTALGITCTGTPITGQVTILSQPVIDSVNWHNITCFGYSNDTITVYATGANGTIFYSIDGGAVDTNTTGIFPGLGAGTYNVYVKDDSGCNVAYTSNPIHITQPSTGLSVTSVVTPVGCTGDSNGVINVLASGGAGGYLYSWSSGQAIQIVSGLGAGTYVITVTDAGGCSASIADTLLQPTPIVDSITSTAVTCFGDANGKADITVSGGVPPYQILWDNFDTTNSIKHLSAQLYRVRITDAYGCEHSDSVRVKRPPLLTGTILVSNVKCYGTNIDTITVNAVGGHASGGYTYTWSPNVSTGASAINVPVGQYYVTVTDTAGCSFVDSATVTQPLTALTDTSITTPVICFNDSNGTINVLARGGQGGYTYFWSSGQDIQYIAGLQAGTYTCTVTDANGCTAATTGILQNPPQMFSDLETTDVSCYGLNDGQGGPSVVGGVPPYTYLWTNFDTAQYLYNLSPGQYGVIITDANGCKQIDTASVNQPSQIVPVFTVTNAVCGGSTGKVIVSVTGGTPGVNGYTYSWTPVASNTDSITGIGAGTYYVTITDSTSCSVTDSVVVTAVASTLSAISIVHNITCNNANNGSITILASGGSGGYSYSWTGTTQTTSTVTGLGAGNYTVTVTDGNGCSISLTDSITNPTAITDNITGTNENCAGDSTGSAILTVSGGTPGYTFLWSGFQASQDLLNIPAGLYRVIITDSNGCEHFDSIIIMQPQALQATVTVTNESCHGGNTGSVAVSVTGGTGAYTYTWSPVASATDSVSGVGAGTYYVTVTDANTCSAVDSGTVTQPLHSITLTQTVSPVVCNSDSNGSIHITLVTGGTGGYIYNWSSGQNTPDINNLPAGIYTISVTDANGCVATLSDTLANPTPITDVITSTNVHPCYGDHNGTATVIPGGGVPPYTVLWSSSDTTTTATHLSAGLYTVVITDSLGCQHSDSVRVTHASKLQDSIAVSNIVCKGVNVDTITITATGSYQSGGYTYSWTPSVSTGPTVTGVPAGVYYVTITDTAGCNTTDSAIVTQPATVLSITPVVNEITCHNADNGSIDIFVSGGVGTYTYGWSTGQTTPVISNLPAGPYTVSVTDGNGCVETDSNTIVNPSVITDTIIGKNATCGGTATGSATLTVSGGTPGYTFLWSNATTGQNLTNVAAGLYRVIITDSNGCTHDDSIVITQPAPLQATVTVRNIGGCNGAGTGSVTVHVTGGTPGAGGYIYSWTPVASTTDSVSGVPAGTYYVTVTDSVGCSITDSGTVMQGASTLSAISIVNDVTCHDADNGSITVLASGGAGGYTYSWTGTTQTTSTVTGLGAGDYSVTVTGGGGCTVTLADTLHNPTAITDVISGTPVTCAGSNNGTATVTPSGGTPGYTYLWSTFAASQAIDSLSGGLYYVIITDNNGCQKRDSINIYEPQPIVLTDTVVPVACAGNTNGSIHIIVSGGVAPFQYAWTPSGPNSPDNTALAAGTYTVTATDASGICSASLSVTLAEPTALIVSYTDREPKCYGDTNGTITLAVSGGTPQYSYTWTSAANGPFTGGQIVDSLVADTYTVTVTDAHGCNVTETITLGQPDFIYISGIKQNVTCHDYNDGQIIAFAYGGTTPYSYDWYIGTFNGDTSTNTNVITQNDPQLAGNAWYTVLVTDVNGCGALFSTTIRNPDSLILALNVTDLTCANNNTGAVSVSVTGGVAPYQYLWNDFTTDSAQAGVSAGTYTVVVTDSDGCHHNQSATVTQPAPIAVSSIVQDPTCSYSSNGEVTLSVQGGHSPYTYSWNTAPVQTADSATGLGAGTYIGIVTDSGGCTQADTFNLTAPPALAVNTAVVNPTCYGGDNGLISLDVTGGSEPYSYNWSTTPAQSGNVANILAAGTYYVTITDVKGCILPDSATLVSPTPLSIAFGAGTSTCAGATDGVVVINAGGGVAPYSYTIGTITQTSDTFNTLSVGTYSVKVDDANGCENSIPLTISPLGSLTDTLIATPQVILAGEPVQLSTSAASDTTILTYFWNPSDSLAFNTGCANGGNCDTVATITPTTTQTFSVTVTNASGCSVTKSVLVTVSDLPEVFIPSAFSPNGDGLNDYFEFAILGASSINVQIWDSWGEEVYNNPDQPNGIDKVSGWNGQYRGQLVNFGSYTYQLVVTYTDGHQQTMSGTVTVIR